MFMLKISFFTTYPISSLCLFVFIVSDRYLGSRRERERDISHKSQKTEYFALDNFWEVRGES